MAEQKRPNPSVAYSFWTLVGSALRKWGRGALRPEYGSSWYLIRTRGSLRQYKHPSKRGLVTVRGKASDEVAPGTLNSVLKQAGLKP